MHVHLKYGIAGLLLTAAHVYAVGQSDTPLCDDACHDAPVGVLNPPAPKNMNLSQILARNQAWAEGVQESNPDFFNDSYSHHQTPQIGWFGCSDSREPESTLLNFRPGEVFGIPLTSKLI